MELPPQARQTFSSTIDADREGDYNAALLVSKSGEEFRSIGNCIWCRSRIRPGETRSRSSAQLWATRCRAILRGEKPVVFRLTTDRVMVAPLICFEDTLGELTRQFVGRREPARERDERRLVSSLGGVTATFGECDLPLRGNTPADGPRRKYRRDLFC